MFSLICAWTNDWANNRNAGDLRRHRTHYDVTVVSPKSFLPCRRHIVRMQSIYFTFHHDVTEVDGLPRGKLLPEMKGPLFVTLAQNYTLRASVVGFTIGPDVSKWEWKCIAIFVKYFCSAKNINLFCLWTADTLLFYLAATLSFFSGVVYGNIDKYVLYKSLSVPVYRLTGLVQGFWWAMTLSPRLNPMKQACRHP